MLGKPVKRELGVVKKTEMLLTLLEYPQRVKEYYSQLSAPQIQELRNFLEQQIVHLSTGKSQTPLTQEQVKNRYEPVPNYYHKQYCREPLEACYNETCLASNPSCFSKKMQTQLEVTLNMIKEYLPS